MKKPTNKAVVEAARRLFEDEGSIKIDDGAKIRRPKRNPSKGAYVQAWVWVADGYVWAGAES